MKKIGVYALLALVVVSGCGKVPGGELDLGQYFEAQGVEGAFILYDSNEDTYVRYNAERCAERFMPASTFKVLNALIALEMGTIADENEVIEWDGVDRGYAAWNQDHNLRTAMAHSAVWFYQELARRAGRERMQHYVDAVGYGNQDISGQIDSFWLEGELRISPEEQIQFLRRLYEGDLPFSDGTMRVVREVIVLEETEEYALSGKTGWASRIEPQIGWFVGYLERDGNVYFFATNVEREASAESLGVRSLEITRKALEWMELLPSD